MDKLNQILDLLEQIESLASGIDFPVADGELFDEGCDAIRTTIKALLDERQRALLERKQNASN